MRRIVVVMVAVAAFGCLPYYPEINEAAEKGDLARVKRLNSGRPALVEGRDIHGDRPIQNAARHGRQEVVRFLLENGADVDRRGRLGQTALFEAVERGHAETVAVLLAGGADTNIPDGYHRRTPLHVACREDYTRFVKRLLEAGADPDARDRHGRTPLHDSASFVHPEWELELHEKMPEYWRKMEEKGLMKHEPELDEEMRQRIESLHRNGLRYLRSEYERTRHLIGKDAREAVAALIGAGADVDACDRWGTTPLHVAAGRGNVPAAEALVQSGADVHAALRRVGYTPLFEAVAERNGEVAELLVKAGADVNTRTEEGETALLRAVRVVSEEIVKLLLENGANVNGADKEGRTPLGEATRPLSETEQAFLELDGNDKQAVRERIAELLRRHGARE